MKNNMSFKNEVFFKFCMSGEDEKSTFIRNSILESLLGFNIVETTATNPGITPKDVIEKEVNLNLLLKHDVDKVCNAEILLARCTKTDLYHAEHYAWNNIVKQFDQGVDIEDLKDLYHIIFIDGFSKISKRLIRHFKFKDQNGVELAERSIYNKIYVHMPMIHQIVKEKGIVNLNAFEQFIYLVVNGPDDKIRKSKGKLVELMLEKHEEIMKHEEWWALAMATEQGGFVQRGNLAEEYDFGLRDGAFKMLHNAIANKYQVKDIELAYTFNIDFIVKAMDLVFSCETYEDFIQKSPLG